MKKGLVVLWVSALLMFSLGALAGCSSPEDEERLIRDSLTAELGQLKNADENVMANLVAYVESGMGASNLAQLESMGLSSRGIVESMFEGFDYTIDDVTVSGDEAVAEVTVKAKNFSEFMTDVTEAVTEMMDDPAQFAGFSQDQIVTAMGDKIKAVLADLPLADSTLDLNYEKKGGTWQPTAGAASALSSVFFQ